MFSSRGRGLDHHTISGHKNNVLIKPFDRADSQENTDSTILFLFLFFYWGSTNPFSTIVYQYGSFAEERYTFLL